MNTVCYTVLIRIELKQMKKEILKKRGIENNSLNLENSMDLVRYRREGYIKNIGRITHLNYV